MPAVVPDIRQVLCNHGFFCLLVVGWWLLFFSSWIDEVLLFCQQLVLVWFERKLVFISDLRFLES